MSQKPYVVALTGSIGSGKSTVAHFLAEQGALVIDADVLAREAVERGTSALGALIQTFGPDITGADGSLNREELAKQIFRDPAKRLKAEAIIHPEVSRLFEERISHASEAATRCPLIVYAVPLLFESGMDLTRFKKIITVSASEETLIHRVCRRDACSRDAVGSRLTAQLSGEEKERRSDIIISNDGTIEELREKVSHLYHNLIREKENACNQQ